MLNLKFIRELFILDLLHENIPTTAAMTLSKIDVQSTERKSYFWCNTSLFVTSLESEFLLEFKNGSLKHLVNGTLVNYVDIPHYINVFYPGIVRIQK